jgi:hypothetical protein
MKRCRDCWSSWKGEREMVRANPTGAARAFVAALSALWASTPALAQEVSRDRAEFDAAAGRSVFQNVLLADPQAFSSRPRRREQLASVVPTPAAIGDASADRYELDAAAGRPVYSSLPGPAPSKREQAAGPKQRIVRVILPSPYGR